MISLLYSCNKSLSFSVKNNKDRHTHIPKMKNHNKSYFALRIKALIHTCCKPTANSNRIIVVTTNTNMNCITNFDSMFFSSNCHVILSVFSLFFIALIHHFKLYSIYRNNITTNIKSINSFHIQKNVRNLPSRHNLNVTNVCKKNCNSNHITNILHNRAIRNFKGFEQILDHRDISFFMSSEKMPKRRCLILFYIFVCYLIL